MTVPEPDADDGRLLSSTRIEAFSDGVFAIAITLLVLDLRTPTTSGSFAHQLAEEWSAYVAYLASFLVIGTVWLTHHRLFARIDRVDGSLLQLNLGVLLLASVLPFPTSIVSAAFRDGTHGDQVTAILVYSGVSILLTLVWQGLVIHVERTPALLDRAADAVALRAELRQGWFGLVPPLVAAPVVLVAPIPALLLQMVTPLVYLGSLHRTRRQPLSRR